MEIERQFNCCHWQLECPTKTFKIFGKILENFQKKLPKEHGKSCIGIFYEKYYDSHIPWHS